MYLDLIEDIDARRRRLAFSALLVLGSSSLFMIALACRCFECGYHTKEERRIHREWTALLQNILCVGSC